MTVNRSILTLGTVVLAALACTRSAPHNTQPDLGQPPRTALESRPMTAPAYTKPDDATLRQRLTPMQYEVTQRAATEPPFRNAFWDHHQDGLYVDVATGEPLFSARDKFDSGTGWPSFVRPVEPGRVVEHADRSHGMVRVEVVSQAGKSHLGHLFDDGPAPTGMRYCINSAALRFVPVQDLEAQGYGAYRKHFSGTAAPVAAKTDNTCATPPPGTDAGCAATVDEIVLAGGCFWGMEELLRAVPGVIETEVGYAGGRTAKPNYEMVKTGATGHAESVRIVYDPKVLPLSELLDKWFFRMHDPTTPNRQGNDVGTQYRSAIFFTSDAQRQEAEAAKVRAGQSGRWQRPIATEIVQAGPFTPAEDYHQDYLQKHPGGYTCHFMRE
jgi:peptide methionine sulfoxide reductase msrA/msrB